MKSSIIWLAGLLLSSGAVARADVRYTITDLGTLGGTSSYANAINNNGQVVGQAALADGSTHAFLYSGGPLIDLGTLGGTSSNALAINDSGTVVGWSKTSANLTQAVVYGGGAMSALQTFPLSTYSIAYGINASGQIVGTANSADSVNYPLASQHQAFVYTNGTATPIPVNVVLGSSAIAINSGGAVAGIFSAGTVLDHSTHVFAYSASTVSQPQWPTGFSGFAGATAINDQGEIVGWAEGPFGFNYAFLWQNGAITTIALPNVSFTEAYGINNLGQIVGVSDTHAFIYTGGVFSDLNNAIDPDSGWTLSSANDINELGQIVGAGISPTGESHAVLLTPTPEPASALTITVAAVSLLARRGHAALS